MQNKQLINTSRYLIPFYYDVNECDSLFANEDWQSYEMNPYYLANYIRELFGKKEEKICQVYYLKKEAWKKYFLPGRFADCTANVSINEIVGEYHFSLNSFFVYQFTTGIGFLTFEIEHKETDLEKIADLNFAIINIFSNEHDNSGKKSLVTFSSKDKQFSLKNIVKEILKFDAYSEEQLRIFPNSRRRKIIGYHNLFSTAAEVNEKIFVKIERGLNHLACIEDCEIEDERKMIYGQNWYIGAGASTAFSQVTAENESFIKNTRQKNIGIDYFCLFLLAIHEREILLHYNYLAVKYCTNPKKLAQLKSKLVYIDVLFSYNTVSTEKGYQQYYLALFDEMSLANLEADINEVIREADDFANQQNDKKENALLSSIAILSVLSVLTDAVELADRVYSGEPFGMIHLGILVFVILGIIIGAFALLKK